MLIPITIGYDGDNKIIDDLVDLVHVLVYLKDEQMDYFNDITKYNLIDTNNHTHLYTFDYRNINSSIIVHNMKKLKSVYRQLNERYETLTNSKCRNIVEYNNSHDEQMKHIVLMIIGYPNMAYPKEKKISDILNKILMLGRAVGIHLINITNDISNMPDVMLLNYVNKICTRNDVDKELFYLPDNFKLHENELVYNRATNDDVLILSYKKEDYMKGN